MKMFKAISMVTVCFIGMIGVASQARAADTKRYSPTGCNAYGTNQASVVYETGRLFNPTASKVQVYCPVVLDADDLTGGYIYLLDRHYDDDICCELRTQSPTSTSRYTSSVCTSGTAETPVKLTFSATSHYTESNRYIRCVIPGEYDSAQSGIYAYGVSEE